MPTVMFFMGITNISSSLPPIGKKDVCRIIH